MHASSFLLVAATAASAFLPQTRAATFSKTVSYTYHTHTATSIPDCGTAIYQTTDVDCPSGCVLAPLNFGVTKNPAYQCKPSAAATSVVASPVVAFMSCDGAAHQFTTTVEPAYGPEWTTCATVSAGATHYAPAVTLSVTTKAP